MLPLALIFWSHHVPAQWERDQSVIHLAGEWKMLEVSKEGAADYRASGVDDAQWKTLKLPGNIISESGHLWLRKTVELPEALKGQDLFFAVGDSRGAQARVYAGGQLIGSKGDPLTGRINAEAGVDGWTIPSGLAPGGRLELALEMRVGKRAGITDSRLLLGRQDLLAPWYFQLQSTRGFIELGGLLLLLSFGAAVAILWRVQGARADKALYRGSLMMVGASSTYLLAKSGMVLGSFLSANQTLELIGSSVFLIGLSVSEYTEAYYLKRSTWFGRINRFVSSGVLLCALTFAGTLGVYKLYMPWLFSLVLYTIGLSVRDVFLQRKVYGPMVTLSVIGVGASGINDLLADLNLVFTPRLFTVGVTNFAIVCAVVVVGEFFLLAEENRQLGASLKLRNEELADALVKAHESARVKSEFLANTSHELRTPLNAIINIPQGLLEQLSPRQARCERCQSLFTLEADEQPPAKCPECGEGTLKVEAGAPTVEAPEAARLLSSVVGSGRHLLAVVNDILDYSKIEAGRVVLHPEPVTLKALFDELRLTMAPVASRANVWLDVAAPPEVTLELDKVKVAQVLINLAGNAIKFSDGKGTVSVKAALAGEKVNISVRDEGIGIAPENQKLIFEGFRQVEGSSTRRFGGTGLGLAISKQLVELHGGAMRLESALGKGSTFLIELPLTRPHEEPKPSGATVIVVVDDEAAAVDTTAVALQPLGVRVVGVRDPREALERIRAEKPKLLVLDVMMPRMSGVELLRALRSDPALAALPVLVSSAYPDNRAAVEALGAAFLSKPWRPGELLREASRLISVEAK
ncbi:MAG: ATP-binding protein [Myxococcaceae bacterium]